MLDGQFETPKATVEGGEIGVGLGLVRVLAQRILMGFELGILFVQDARALKGALPLCGAAHAQQGLPDSEECGRFVRTEVCDLAQLALGFLVVA